MYRMRSYQQVLYGKYNDFVSAWTELNRIEQSRGRHTASIWVPTVGTGNEVMLEWEYPDLATLQAESDAFNQDTDSMRVFRQTASLVVQGSNRSELWEPGGTIA